jgi:hypothetical protein
MKDPLFKKLEQLVDGTKRAISESDYNKLLKQRLTDAGLTLELTEQEKAVKDKFNTSEFGLILKGGTLKGELKGKYDTLSVAEKASIAEVVKKQKELNSKGAEIGRIKKSISDQCVMFADAELELVKSNRLYLILPLNVEVEGIEVSPRLTLEGLATGETLRSFTVKEVADRDRALAFLALQNGSRDDFDQLEEFSPKLNAIFGDDTDALEEYIKNVGTFQSNGVIKKAADLIEWRDTGKVLADKRWAKLLSDPQAMLVIGKLIYRHEEFEAKFGSKFPKNLDEFLAVGLEIDCPGSMARIRALDESAMPKGWSKDRLIEFAKEYYLQRTKSNTDFVGTSTMEKGLDLAIDIILDPRRRADNAKIPDITINHADVMAAYDEMIEKEIMPKISALPAGAKAQALAAMAKTREEILAKVSKYKMRKLGSDDYRGFILGRYTASCQSIDGNSSQVVKYGMMEEDSGFYVIENDRGQIKSQSWAWVDKSGKSIIFDSYERSGSEHDELCPLFYRAMQRKMEEHFEHVLLGKGGQTPNIHFEEGEAREMPSQRPGYTYLPNGTLYGDSSSVYDLKEEVINFRKLLEIGIPIRLLIEHYKVFGIRKEPSIMDFYITKKNAYGARVLESSAEQILIKYVEEASDKLEDEELLNVLNKSNTNGSKLLSAAILKAAGDRIPQDAIEATFFYFIGTGLDEKILEMLGSRVSNDFLSKAFLAASNRNASKLLTKLLTYPEIASNELINEAFLQAASSSISTFKQLLEVGAGKITAETFNQALINAAQRGNASIIKKIWEVTSDKITAETLNKALLSASKLYDENLALKATEEILRVARDKITDETFNQALINAAQRGNASIIKKIWEVTSDKIANETLNEVLLSASKSYPEDRALKTIEEILRVARDKITDETFNQALLSTSKFYDENLALKATEGILSLVRDKIKDETFNQALINAAEKGNASTIKKICEVASDKITAETLNEALLAVSKSYSEDKALKGIEEILSIAKDKITDETFNQALINAAEKGNASTIKKICEVASDKITAETLNEVLLSASKFDSEDEDKALKITEEILSIAKDKITDETFNQALINAAQRGNKNFVKRLLEVANDKITAETLNQIIRHAFYNSEIIITLLEKRSSDITDDTINFVVSEQSKFAKAQTMQKILSTVGDRVTPSNLKTIIERLPKLSDMIPIIEKKRKISSLVESVVEKVKQTYLKRADVERYKNFKAYSHERNGVVEVLSHLIRENLGLLLTNPAYKDLPREMLERKIVDNLSSPESIALVDKFLADNAPKSGEHGIGSERAKALFGKSELADYFVGQILSTTEAVKKDHTHSAVDLARHRLEMSEVHDHKMHPEAVPAVGERKGATRA